KLLQQARSLGLNILAGRIDLIAEFDQKNKPLNDFLKLLHGLGTPVAIELDADAFAATIDQKQPQLHMDVIYTTEIGIEDIDSFLEIPRGTFQPYQEKTSSVSELAQEKTEKATANQTPEKILLKDNNEPTLRVKVSLLENLMNLAGELVLSRNQLREAINRNDLRSIRISGQRMGQVTTDIQEAIMMTRLQPLDRVFSKFPRMLRDLSKQLNKEIKLTMEGREVELDKTLIEGLGDPLTHMVRNAIDHGIETPEERKSAGKSLPAQIRINAFYEASRVVVEVTDDGKGIDGEKVCQKAIDRGLISFEKAKSMSMKEMQNLIFLPGLSTASAVTDLSGRGVGMDVVKSNIDRLGGKVEILSEIGRGSSFKIKLPLTLAIIPSLILTSSDEMFAIPQANVLEMLLIPAEMVKRKIEIIGTQEVLVLRGKLLPLISLNRFLGKGKTVYQTQTVASIADRRVRIADRRSQRRNQRSVGLVPTVDERNLKHRNDGRRLQSASGLNVIVVTTGTFNFALIVDKPLFTEEIVVKQLGQDLKTLTEYSGATILGDGKIALIIDVMGLASRANLIAQQSAIGASLVDSNKVFNHDQLTIPFLSFKLGNPELYVLPLFLVSRLEKLHPGSLISCGDWKAVQIQEKLLPVFMISGQHKLDNLSEDHEWGIIVLRIRNREIGLIAALPIQVVELRPEFDKTVLRQPGIAGSTVWKNESILFLDILEIVSLVKPELLNEPLIQAGSQPQSPKIAVFEPEKFFQNQLKMQVENEGFAVSLFDSIPELEKCFSAPETGFRAILADMSSLRQDRFIGLRKLRKACKADGVRIAALGSNSADFSDDFAAEGIECVIPKLEMQQMSEWLSALRQNN
ncbi:MAG: chemotaxis protein CheA, partial [Candidatus Rifleibacteriota bacterium]